MLWNAYQIDELNDVADQTIGFKCVKWNEKDKTCPKWQACQPKRNSGRTRCNYDELIESLGRAPTPKDWGVYDSNGNMDNVETAKKCYTRYTTAPGKNAKVYNFPPFTCMKNSNVLFNDYLRRMSDLVDNTYKNKATDANRGLFASFDATLAQVNEARAGDHGPFLIKEAQAKLGSKMEIQIQKVGAGNNPATGEPWETVDWKETADKAKANGVADVDKEIADFFDGFYGPGSKSTPAKQHHAVINSYKQMADRRLTCR
ncbi:hypothetical protein F4818DRAFT_455704 [Hypoxylon cercidicola]|nr:hypothetical protein F4818DRAFT_455704 [Hypoxylon cercidicola]